MKLPSLTGLTPRRKTILQELNLDKVEALLEYVPFRYVDRRELKSARQARSTEEPVTLVGRATDIRLQGRGKRARLEVLFTDGDDPFKAVWFRGVHYIRKQIQQGALYTVHGTPRLFGNTLSIAHPELRKIERLDESQKSLGVRPVYPGNQKLAKAGVQSRLLQSWAGELLDKSPPREYLPESIRTELNLPTLSEAYRMAHLPDSPDEPLQGIHRLKFNELLFFEMGMAEIRYREYEKQPGERFERQEFTDRFLQHHLPFELTDGQVSALRDIRRDVSSGRQMHRLLQGDVGSGKTVVAAATLLMGIENGFQGALLAPTELLAEQHAATLTSLFEGLDIDIRLLTGSRNRAARREILASLSAGQCNLIVGTHALIQDEVHFQQLGIAVIDEQHRFGVEQRAALNKKGRSPHLLVMSATPIPRSLALSIYSDLDVSRIQGLPPGRKPVRTAVRGDNRRSDVETFLEKNMDERGQIYVVYPLIEESEAMDLKDATRGYESLKRRFPDSRIGLLHGRMDTDEKEAIMNSFRSGELDILVSTTVIEVGVDVPNANVMIIEQAERFGLSQLHQLRGRVGRGDRQSYCILMPGSELTESGRFRLSKMVQTQDGFQIAEADLQLRGPGDFLGTRQSGLPEFRHADIVEDRSLLEKARTIALSLMQQGPESLANQYPLLYERFQSWFSERFDWFRQG
ncbi:MAG: ATP-dependent DNA helicase RecG [Bacteroidota bacterium]